MNTSVRFLPAVYLLVSLLTAGSPTASAQARLVLNGAIVTLSNGARLVLENNAPEAITRLAGYMVSEGENNVIRWHIGTATGAYVVPWGYAGAYIPLSFTTSGAAGNGYFVLSTYRTPDWNNTAALPAGIPSFNGVTGTDQSAFAVDRFWQLQATGYTTRPTLASVTFTYRDAEHTATGNTIEETALRPTRWNSTAGTWTDLVTAPSRNPGQNTVSLATIAGTDLYPWWTLSAAGVNRYWVATSSSPWHNAASWSNSAGGPGGADIPQPWDAAIFDGARDGVCTLGDAVRIGSLDIQAGYTGIVNQAAQTLDIRGGATFAGGTFLGGTKAVHVGDDLILSGTAFVAPADTLVVGGDIHFDGGSFDHNGGTLRLSGNGPGTQSLAGTQLLAVNDLHITGTTATPAAAVQSEVDLHGVLTLAGNVVLDADGTGGVGRFRLISAADAPTVDGAIAALPAGAAVTGSVTVQRHMSLEGPDNGRIYRYIASPLQNAAVSDLQQEIPVTGPFAGASTCPGCGRRASLFYYDERHITDTNQDGTVDLDDGYIGFPGASNGELFAPGRGYALYVRGDRISSARWDLRGTIVAGNVSPVALPMSYTTSGVLANDGWNLVGNPFPSTIDWEAAGWTRQNVEHALYIRDNGTAMGGFASWNGVVGTNGGSRYIALGQAFWVKADGTGSPTLLATEAVKAPRETATFFRTGPPANVLRLVLADQHQQDEAVIHFRDDATAGFDRHADARKLRGALFNVGTQAQSGEILSINSRPLPTCNDSIGVALDNLPAGSYELTLSGLESFGNDWIITCRDRWLGTEKIVTGGLVYPFMVTADSASTGHRRFMISVLRSAGAVDIRYENDTLSVDHPGTVQWYYNGEIIPEATEATLAVTQPGLYRAAVVANDCLLTGELNLSVLATGEPERAGIAVYPNPANDQLTIVLPAASHAWQVTLIDGLGRVCSEHAIRQKGTLSLRTLPPGVYYLRIQGNTRQAVVKVIRQ